MADKKERKVIGHFTDDRNIYCVECINKNREIMEKIERAITADENNAENLLLIRDKKLAERYIKNWFEHSKHSEVYTGRGR